jgi:hypothetical protein
MAVLKASRTAQYPLVADFTFNFDDTAVDSVTGVSKTFGDTYTDAIIFDAIPMPVGAVICGGELIVETQGVGPTAYTVKLGIAGNDACYLAATSLLTADNTRTALLLTSALASNAGANIRMTIASTVADASAGKFRLRVMYTLDRRASENNV